MCVVNGNDGGKWPVHTWLSLAPLGWPSVCLLRLNIPRRSSCITPSPGDTGIRGSILKMPCFCCYHDNLGGGKEEAQPSTKCLHTCFFFFFETCSANLISGSMKAAPAAALLLFLFAGECVCPGESLNLPLEKNKRAGVLYLIGTRRSRLHKSAT